MKQFLKFGFLFLFICSRVLAQTMLADITIPVKTEFATYYPHKVSIVPHIPGYDPGKNLENVGNLKSFNFSPAAISLLAQNHFVVAPASRTILAKNIVGYNELFDIYCESRENNIPIFVTSDALLHTFHLCFDYILKTCEEKSFYQQLNSLLTLMLDETQRQYTNSTQEIVHNALIKNLNYLIVAKKLLDSTYVEPVNGGLYLQELTLIESTADYNVSPIFGYNEDYSQYIVRGHYTRTPLLRHYFKSMMWLGRMTFACENPEDPFSREATLRALLLVQAMEKISPQGLEKWGGIYQPTVFFVGKSDDIHFIQYIQLAHSIYGDNWVNLGPDFLSEESLLTKFLKSTANLPGAAITYQGQPQKGFRFMGQRFIPDSWILDELVVNKIPDRFMPTGLDVMYVLGSNRAKELLSAEDKSNSYYLAKLEELRNIFLQYPPETWAQNIYWNWLYSLMPLLCIKSADVPYFMRTLAWVDKDLYAALASWAELRHDTILYAKQSGSETSLPPSATVHQGYVEPNPYLFARLAALSDYLYAGLKNRNLLFDEFKVALELFSATAIHLQKISEKELMDTPLTGNDYALIFDIGKKLYDIITFGRGDIKGPRPGGTDGLEPMPVIADVHTDANSYRVLEEGVGFPYAIYVICPIEGQSVITKGACYSYYEFTWPANDRLTDENWRQILTSPSTPQPPLWCSTFITPELNTSETQNDFFRWQKPYSNNIDVRIDPETPVMSDTVRISFQFSSNETSNQKPKITITSPNGTFFYLTCNRSGDAYHPLFSSSVSTSGFEAGRYYIDIQGTQSDNIFSFRSHFNLKSSTRVVHNNKSNVENYEFFQNWPNPFNGQTQIQYTITAVSYVTISIFDLSGRLVRQLYSGNIPEGSHRLIWDGRTDSGVPCTSGIYIAKLTAEEKQFQKRLILLR